MSSPNSHSCASSIASFPALDALVGGWLLKICSGEHSFVVCMELYRMELPSFTPSSGDAVCFTSGEIGAVGSICASGPVEWAI